MNFGDTQTLKNCQQVKERKFQKNFTYSLMFWYFCNYIFKV
jgi:hypothetical protein